MLVANSLYCRTTCILPTSSQAGALAFWALEEWPHETRKIPSIANGGLVGVQLHQQIIRKYVICQRRKWTGQDGGAVISSLQMHEDWVTVQHDILQRALASERQAQQPAVIRRRS
jgi:hypothetical protein